MEEQAFPRTTVGGVSLSRLIMGTNWLLGWSHTGAAADRQIKARYDRPETFEEILEAYLSQGVDTIMGPIGRAPELLTAIRRTEQKTGRAIIRVDTPILNIDDSETGRREALQTIRQCRDDGSTFCLIHHSSMEQLVDKNRGQIRRLDDYTRMIRDAGLIPGLSAHMPEAVVYSDANGYDVETYIQLYNPMGFLMQIEVESIARIIHSAKKPVMTIKPMAAGRCTPFVGLNFVWNTIRDCDLVTVGAGTAAEALEDIEISRAALDRRFPDLECRSSPNTRQAAFGHAQSG